MRKIDVIAGLVMGALILALAVACKAAEPTPLPPTPTPTPKDAFAITIEPIGHWHFLKSKKLLFKVTEAATGQGKAGLPVEIQVARTGSTRVTVRSVEKGQVKDEGQGVYSLENTPTEFEPYAFSLRFLYEGQLFASQPFVAEIAKDGEEGIKVEAKGTTYVYQIRYFWKPGHAHASDKDKVTLSFELMRGIQEGTAINWEQPWRNTVNHVTNADHPEIKVESEDGTVKEELHPVYKGKGVYEAQRLFTVAEVGKEKHYHIRFSFTDPYNGAKVTHKEAYELKVSAPH